jgi:hypothetical protein
MREKIDPWRNLPMTYLYGKEGISGIQCYTNYPNCLVAHWDDRTDGEQACEEWEHQVHFERDVYGEHCTQKPHDG